MFDKSATTSCDFSQVLNCASVIPEGHLQPRHHLAQVRVDFPPHLLEHLRPQLRLQATHCWQSPGSRGRTAEMSVVCTAANINRACQITFFPA